MLVQCSDNSSKLGFFVIDSVYVAKGVEYPADYCTMQVYENPRDKESKIIDLPVIRIRTNSNDPGAPVFVLNDGPGLSNFEQNLPLGLLNNHDLIIIGYRGVDGSVNLNIPTVNNLIKNKNFLSDANLDLAALAFDKGLSHLRDSLEIDLKMYNLENMAYDLESARQAFMYQKINLFTVGFGARIAQFYSAIAPNSIFRIFMERPKAYGALVLDPKHIDNVIDFINYSSTDYNGGKGFRSLIFEALKKTANNSDLEFDFDKIIFQTINSTNNSQGPALVNEAFLSANQGDYESLKYLEETFDNSDISLNFGDYAVKILTSEFDRNKNYRKDFGFSLEPQLVGSPLAKFICGSLQKSKLLNDIHALEVSNPDKLNGEVFIVMCNLDIYSPYELAEFDLKNKYYNAKSMLMSDYSPQDLYTYNYSSYSKSVSEFLYIGDTKLFVSYPLEINFKPNKTLKQISLERIQ